MRAVWDFGGLATGTLALIASQVVDQLPGLPGLSPWLNYGGLGLLAVTLLGLLYREQQRTKEQQEAFALEQESCLGLPNYRRREEKSQGPVLPRHGHLLQF